MQVRRLMALAEDLARLWRGRVPRVANSPLVVSLGLVSLALLAVLVVQPPSPAASPGRASPTRTLTTRGLASTSTPARPTTTPSSSATPTPQRRLTAIKHVVQEGETLSGIADIYRISADALMWANGGVDDPDFLAVGQELVVPPVTGILHTVFEGDSLLTIAEMYGAQVEEIAEANELQPPYLIVVGQMLVVPGGSPPAPTSTPEMVAVAEEPPPPTPTPVPVATVIPHPLLSDDGAAFIATILGPAKESQQETGVPVSVTLAQAILDTNWGKSGLAVQANNLFGIKGRPYPGPAGVVWMDTWEYWNGQDIVAKEPFRAYNTAAESVLDHGRHLRDSPRYAEAMQHTDDPRLFIRLVHEAGYATDPNYADKVIRIMDRYDLYAYDAP
ncbi:MAG: LysM peptidoglycan-binding domain-containing protein [Dehalococcoidales bacterium]|nr:LysM peptidoglycan-binding domain-containing protein [Dehalococcoidales bacterium]